MFNEFEKNKNDSTDTSSRESLNINFIEEIGKTVSKGLQSVIDVIPKIKRTEFSVLLTEMLEKYSKFSADISSAGEKYGAKAKEVGAIGRLSSKIGLEINTLTDSSEEHIAQILIDSITDDMTDTMRLIRDNENTSCSEKIISVARDFSNFQEKAIEKIKAFL